LVRLDVAWHLAQRIRPLARVISLCFGLFIALLKPLKISWIGRFHCF